MYIMVKYLHLTGKGLNKPFDVGFDMGRIAGLGQSESFMASRTCNVYEGGKGFSTEETS